MSASDLAVNVNQGASQPFLVPGQIKLFGRVPPVPLDRKSVV